MERQASADVGALVDISTLAWAGLAGGKVGDLIFFAHQYMFNLNLYIFSNYFIPDRPEVD